MGNSSLTEIRIDKICAALLGEELELNMATRVDATEDEALGGGEDEWEVKMKKKNMKGRRKR